MTRVLDVARTGERAWTVYPLEGDPTAQAERTYDNQAAAWHHATWQPLHESNVLPEMHTGESIFIDSRVVRGYTADPRFAETVPASSYAPAFAEKASQLVTAFIQSRINDPAYMTIHGEEVPMTAETETQETAQDAQNTPSESLVGDDGATMPFDAYLAAYDALSDSDRNAYDNFSALAQSASSDQGRDFWRSKAEEVLANSA